MAHGTQGTRPRQLGTVVELVDDEMAPDSAGGVLPSVRRPHSGSTSALQVAIAVDGWGVGGSSADTAQ
jgi:hypothetical protein